MFGAGVAITLAKDIKLVAMRVSTYRVAKIRPNAPSAAACALVVDVHPTDGAKFAAFPLNVRWKVRVHFGGADHVAEQQHIR